MTRRASAPPPPLTEEQVRAQHRATADEPRALCRVPRCDEQARHRGVCPHHLDALRHRGLLDQYALPSRRPRQPVGEPATAPAATSSAPQAAPPAAGLGSVMVELRDLARRLAGAGTPEELVLEVLATCLEAQLWARGVRGDRETWRLLCGLLLPAVPGVEVLCSR